MDLSGKRRLLAAAVGLLLVALVALTLSTSDPTSETATTTTTESTDPSQPSERTQPGGPTEPTQPGEPTEPTQPSERTAATQPGEPTEPTQPSERTAATQPGERTAATERTEAATEPRRAKGGAARTQLPLGGRRLFPRYRLVAYYGTAGTGSLGVLGEAPPQQTTRRLREVARRYRGGRPEVQPAYELISTVADGSPGPDGDYSHHIDRSSVRTYVQAARRNKAYLVLDLQPGRSSFLSQARELRWALEKPWVGLALDPEWRMGPRQVPGQQIGSVRAAEVNRVSAWLARLTRANDLPQKLLMLHQFRTDMVLNPERIVSRPGLAMLQHIDGFGTRSQKLQTYRTVERSEQFTMGFKLFYDEDIDLFGPRHVLDLRPRIRYVSYQ